MKTAVRSYRALSTGKCFISKAHLAAERLGLMNAAVLAAFAEGPEISGDL